MAMTMDGGGVLYRIGVDSKGAVQATQNFSTTFEKTMKTATRLLKAFGLALGTKALVNFTQKASQLTDAIDKNSQRLGMSTKAYQEWDYVMSQNGGSIDGLVTGMKTLRNTIQEAKDGNKKYGETLKDLEKKSGMVINRNADEQTQFNQTVKALQKLDNASERAKMAQDLFGRSAVDLIPLLNQTSEDVEKLKNEANEYGMVLSDDVIKNGVVFNDALDKMKRTISSLSTNIASALMPSFTNMFNGIAGIVKSINLAVVKYIPKFQLSLQYVGALGQLAFMKMKEVLAEVVGLLDKAGVSNFIKARIEMVGDIWEALKKCFETGSIAPLFESGSASNILKIGTELFLVAGTASALMTAIKSGLGLIAGGGAGATAGAGASGMAGALALGVMSILVQLKEAQTKKDYQAFGANMALALAVGLGVGTFVSPMAGVLAFDVIMNLKIGESAWDNIKNPWKTGNLKGIDMNQEALKGINEKDLSGFIDDFALRLKSESSDKAKLIQDIARDEIGQNILLGLGYSLKDVGGLSEEAGDDFIENFKAVLGIHSPSKVMEKMGEYIAIGLQMGLDGNIGEAVSYITKAFEECWAELEAEMQEAIDKANAEIDGLLKKTENGTGKMSEFWKRHAQAIANAVSPVFQAMEDDIANGCLSWATFARSGLEAIASVVEALGLQLIVKSVEALPNFYLSALYAGGATLAYASAGMIKGMSNRFEYGGIVGGTGITGDKHQIFANAGELILSRAQQASIASQLDAGGRGGTISINFNGQTFGDRKTIASYVYNGIRSAQNEGALRAW